MRRILRVCAIAMLPLAATAQDGEELRLVKRTLGKAQEFSFKNNREYCGYVVYDENNMLRVTRMTKGRKNSCMSHDYPKDWTAIASFHTHGAHVDGESFEVPSYSDAEGDEQEGVDGYVSTPGGRLWYIDSETREISLICGLNCLPSDPRFYEYDEVRPPKFFTYEELREYELDG